MRRIVHVSGWVLTSGVLALGVTGCAAFRASTQTVDVTRTPHFDARYDAGDMRRITQNVVDKLLASPFLLKQSEPPIMMIAGVQNRTNDHVDTKNITDRMRVLLIQSGGVRFVNEARRADLLQEQGYQAANVAPEMQLAIGRQLGAAYMVSGALTEIKRSSPRQVRVSKQELRYYKFTFEVTDLQTSEIVWITDEEFSRLASKPLIGW
jgi:uncharacterized protein (TIGR02722 family)